MFFKHVIGLLSGTGGDLASRAAGMPTVEFYERTEQGGTKDTEDGGAKDTEGQRTRRDGT